MWDGSIKVLYLSDDVPGNAVAQFKKEGKVDPKYFEFITVYSLIGFESKFNRNIMIGAHGYIKYMDEQDIRDYYGFDFLP